MTLIPSEARFIERAGTTGAIEPTGPATSRGLRVCLASLAPFVGGAEIAAERLAAGLQAAGHDVLVVLGARGAVLDRIERAGLRCVHTPMYFTDKWHCVRYFRARNRLRWVLKQHRPDVVHSNDLPTHQFVSGAARGLGVPRICHHRFLYSGETIDWLNKFHAEHHFFISWSVMDELCRQSADLASASHSVVYDGLSVPPADPTVRERQEARRRLGLPLDRLIVTFAGQIILIKGIADLIHAWSQLDPDLTDRATLVVVGDDLQSGGKYLREMRKLADRLSCAVQFVGFQDQVSPWLTASDLSVVPSHVEPLSLATLEAMSHALPVIGSSVGGIREIIEHERTGLLVPPGAPGEIAAALRACSEMSPFDAGSVRWAAVGAPIGSA